MTIHVTVSSELPKGLHGLANPKPYIRTIKNQCCDTCNAGPSADGLSEACKFQGVHVYVKVRRQTFLVNILYLNRLHIYTLYPYIPIYIYTLYPYIYISLYIYRDIGLYIYLNRSPSSHSDSPPPRSKQHIWHMAVAAHGSRGCGYVPGNMQ